MRYSRRVPAISETTISPSFFLIEPEIAPRTECACQPVAFIRSSTLAPFGWRNSAVMVAILPVGRASPFLAPRVDSLAVITADGLFDLIREVDFGFCTDAARSFLD